MKKIFMIFAVCFLGLSTPTLGYNTIEQQCYNNTKESSYLPTSSGINIFGNDNDWFCYGVSNNKISCFLADSDACIKNTVVCALGTYTQPVSNWTRTQNGYQTTYSGALIGQRVCATAYQGSGSDKWYDKDDFQQPKTFTDCTDTKWQRNDSISKTNEVMVINNKAEISNNNYPMQYWIHYDINDSPKYPEICVGYYCAGADGKYTEPCDDGTCSDNCPDDDTTPPDPDPVDSSPVPGTDPAPTPSTPNIPHRDTVKPYLDALDAKCKK